jgi:hypothetical protein
MVALNLPLWRYNLSPANPHQGVSVPSYDIPHAEVSTAPTDKLVFIVALN